MTLPVRGWVKSAALVISILAIGPIAQAQLRSSTIAGSVTDPNGGMVARAEVKLTDQATNVTSTTKTNDSGGYSFPYLQAGNYTLTVTAGGFSTYEQRGITLTAAENVKVDVMLKLGAVTTAVDVSAATVELQTDSSTFQTAVDKNVIDAVPNPTQNPLYYAMLQANVVPTVNSMDTSSINSFGIGINGRRQYSALGINGGKAFSNDIQVDGLPVMGGGYNEASVLPNTEGLSEVRVISNNFTAEYGHGQAAISMNTVSGTNQYHGQATYQIRNEALNANTFSNNAQNIKRPPFKVNEFGGAVGGHIIRDKLFFFSSYHYLMHNRGIANLATVPTALERTGNFSQTTVADTNGAAIPVQIYDPYNIALIGPQLYQRAPFPNAIIPNPSKSVLQMMSFYPLPNRTPTNLVTGAQNFQSSTVETVRRHNLSNRVDYHRGKQSIYGSGGLEYGNVENPRLFGTSPVNGAPAVTKDKNPYGQIGDTIILSPTVVLDARYGYNRINTATLAGDKSGFTDYNAWGVPQNVQSLMLVYGAAPWVSPGSPWTALTDGFFTNKRERQQSHNISGSVTKTLGKWTLKQGIQYRALLSNFQDLEEASTALQAIGFAQGGNFTFKYLDPNGNTTAQDNGPTVNGFGPAGIFTGAGTWFVRPGANVTPAFAQKYAALYSQNDWRVSPKLTLNLGLRWDVQPGPTERYNRMSFYDLTRQNTWNTQGVIGFPNTNGYGRNLWETEWNDIQPRIGAAYKAKWDFVIRGGFGITYLPSNTGYFSGPTDYGANSFSPGVNTVQYPNSDGIPAQFSSAPPILAAIGANSAAPQIYGQQSSPLFDHFFRNGKVYQWNTFIEKQVKTWLVSVGYSGTAGRHLITNNYAVQNQQLISPSLLASWHDQYVASNGTINPATQLIANPFQPAGGSLIPFSGTLGQPTLARQVTVYPYPLLTANMSRSNGFSDYQSMIVSAEHRVAHGLFVNASYVWSKSLGFSLTDIADGQGFNPAGSPIQIMDYKDSHNNRMYTTTDVPQRFVLTAVYETPKVSSNKFVNHVIGNWGIAPVLVMQGGTPIPISGDSSGAINGHPNRIPGVPAVVAPSAQHWYDGKQTVTLSCGRTITPPANTFLYYNPCAFQGQVVSTPNGSTVVDQYWYGTAAYDYGDIRTRGMYNIDLTLRRDFRITERYKLQISAAATNLLNHSEFVGAFSGALGSTNTTTNAASGLLPGMGTGTGFGAMGYATYVTRQITMNARFRF